MDSESFVHDAWDGGHHCFYCGRSAAGTGVLERKGVGVFGLEDE